MQHKIYISPIILLLFTVFLATGCSKEKSIGCLTIIDSVDLSENINHCITYPVSILSHKNKLYILGDEIISIYDHELNFIKSFGGNGQAPGEFKAGNDLCVLNDTLFVSDLGNYRIQSFSLDGEFLSSFKCDLPTKIDKVNYQLIVSSFDVLDHLKIYIPRSKIAENTFNLKPVKAHKELLKTFPIYSVLNEKVILSCSNNEVSAFFEISTDETKELELSNKFMEMDISDVSNMVTHNNKLYVIGFILDRSNNKEYEVSSSKQAKELANFKEILFEIDGEYNVLNQYLIPDNIIAMRHTLCVTDSNIYIVDVFNKNLYKLKMEN